MRIDRDHVGRLSAEQEDQPVRPLPDSAAHPACLRELQLFPGRAHRPQVDEQELRSVACACGPRDDGARQGDGLPVRGDREDGAVDDFHPPPDRTKGHGIHARQLGALALPQKPKDGRPDRRCVGGLGHRGARLRRVGSSSALAGAPRRGEEERDHNREPRHFCLLYASEHVCVPPGLDSHNLREREGGSYSSDVGVLGSCVQ